MEENEITIKILLDKGTNINQSLYLDIINGLNDRYVPCNQISLNGKIVFDNTQGFIKEERSEDAQ